MKINKTKFYEVFEAEGKKKLLLTKNLVRGETVYDEKLFEENGVEYREWDAGRSKLAAFILKGADQIAIRPDSIVLYLGASTGTTVSHVSDIAKDGFVFAVEFAPIVARELVFLAEKRKNIAPILADANKPDEYRDKICEVGMVYQDIAQKNQVEIFIKNLEFLKEGGFGLLAIKARSVDVTKKPSAVFNAVKQKLEKEVKIIDSRTLDPYQKDHCMFLVKK